MERTVSQNGLVGFALTKGFRQNPSFFQQGTLLDCIGRTGGEKGMEFLHYNKLLGRESGHRRATGFRRNTFVGSYAGKNNQLGRFNSFFGSSAGKMNTSGTGNSFFGDRAGQANTSSNNSFFGFVAFLPLFSTACLEGFLLHLILKTQPRPGSHFLF